MSLLEFSLDIEAGSGIPSRRSALDENVTLRAYWLGQAGFLLDSATARVVIDPYLSDSLALKYQGTRFPHHRMMPPPTIAEDLKDVDWVLSTHRHTDHLDPGTLPVLAEANPHCRFLLPKSAADTALKRGVPAGRMTVCDSGDHMLLPVREGEENLKLSVVPAAHEDREYDEEGHDLYLGYIVEIGGCKAYHSGDTIPFPELDEALSGFDIDLAFLPVNGRDEERRKNGVPGNLTLDEAVDLALRQDISFAIGHHFDMFSFNTIEREWGEQRISDLLRRFEERRYVLANTGVKYELRRQFS